MAETGLNEVSGTALALRATGIVRTYFTTDPPATVLAGIDLTVAAGEFVAVMGASGSGKSTLLYGVSGMDRPTEGTVELEGRDLTSLDDDELSRVRLTRMGFIFQQAHFLHNLNIFDNVALPALKARPKQRDAVVAEVDALLERFGIAHVKSNGITEVSGGQLQRASICRALAGGPAILFADEPTGALNSAATLDVMAAIDEAHAGGTTLVMVTHDPSVAARADRVVYQRDGLVVDEFVPGRSEAELREDELLSWLRAHGF